MLNIAVIDLIACGSSVLVYQRIYETDSAYMFISYGPCCVLGSTFCSTAAYVWLHGYTHSIYGLLLSFSYRYYILLKPPPRVRTIVAIILLSYIPSLVQLIATLSAGDNGYAVQEKLSLLIGRNVFDKCASGFLNLHDWRYLLFVLHLILSVVPIYTAILIIRRKIVTTLRKAATYSERTKRMHSQLVKAITYQTCLPLCSILSLVLYLLGGLITSNYPMSHYAYMLIGLVPITSPLLTLYFVKPYKDWVVSVFSSKNISTLIIEQSNENRRF
ncbi:unnamed protein product [Cylicocyclus nassatus]|uniref:G-protein coupled receptors family 1 profile domain-containing protein n=1 Tax=Cylicocyclus nassatus TaxID=53992 RepID=A0AA36M4S7_CYLNA|nr:unnamed protein product [Cylicocyclus nassatus]